MNKTKKIVLLGILTALYVVLSFCMKFTVIGNIQIDFGYIVLRWHVVSLDHGDLWWVHLAVPLRASCSLHMDLVSAGLLLIL